MKYTLIVVLLMILNLSQNIFAQSQYEFSSGSDIPIISGITFIGGTAYFLNNENSIPPEEMDKLNRWEINFIDRGATDNWSENSAFASDILLGFMMLAPLGMIADNNIANNAGVFLSIYSESQLLNSTSTYLIKNIFRRKRPFLYNPEAPISKKIENDAIKSFPSGHTSSAFCSAVFIGSTYEGYNLNPNLRGLIWVSGITLATTTALLRYFAGKHYPTDIISGAILGSMIGYFIPKLHETDNKNKIQDPVYFLNFNFNF